MKLTDRTNRKYGKLTVISRAPDAILKSGIKRVMWLCSCDCGAETSVAASNLANGHTQSCGCMVKEVCSRNFKVHGLTDTKAYRTWCAIKGRCSSPGLENYKFYGGRGIKVCERWKASFEAFLEDMGHPPTPNHSIDRIDHNGDYEPGNCRWSDALEQANNKRNNRVYTFAGKTMSVSMWARELGISPYTLFTRLKTWPVERALTTPKLRP
jgi:hypothetical protein